MSWLLEQLAPLASQELLSQSVPLAAGQTGLSIAYDMPTLYGYDTDEHGPWRGVVINPELWITPPSAGEPDEELESEGCLSFRRPGGLVCLVNLSGAPVPVPEGRVLLSSLPVDDGTLPDDAAVWLQG